VLPNIQELATVSSWPKPLLIFCAMAKISVLIGCEWQILQFLVKNIFDK
jgi:hypothetical protein